MIVGISTVELYLPGINSLKAKRRIINSIKATIRQQFNVSISEIDYLDKWQRSLLGIVGISNDSRFMEFMLKKVIDAINRKGDVSIIDSSIEVNYAIQTKESKLPYNGNGF
ncbi:DUF503 domain-containing protein [candidate division WOR-3 bacterium]|nr:DUF503 domain-containing protein [candidate division WOR-3 bacterium]MCK4527061.1 DUF503 domain-containing protein [candidate division WOR-3 bacterium]